MPALPTALSAAAVAAAAGGGGSAPHIIYVMGDDVGWHDVSWHNSEINTPTLQGLLKDGVELDRMYTFKYCSPTRSSFLSGRLPIHNTQINNEASMHGKQYICGVDMRMTMLPAKLAAAGYVSYQLGKWHAGYYTNRMIPVNRGFNHSFGYLSGGEDHYSQMTGAWPGGVPTDPDSVWPARTNLAVDLWRDDGPAYGENGTLYSAFLYTGEAVRNIERHDPSAPMFMYLALQNNHCPLQVPERFQDPAITNPLRRIYHGMSAALDESVANVTAALRARGMWARTYLFFTSDNGGPIHDPASGCTSIDPAEPGMTGANNYPLRGGKVSDYEGGVRVNAFLSGGALPEAMRGRSRDGTMHVADMHATICALAGVPLADPAVVEDVPPVDGLDMWPYLSGAAPESPRTELMLGWWGNATVIPGGNRQTPPARWEQATGGALIVGDHKILYGYQLGMAYWTGPEHPNGTADAYPVVDCYPDPCLFDIRQDPTEHVNLAGSKPKLLAAMQKKLDKYIAGFFQASDIGPVTTCRAEADVIADNRGFFAPPCA